MTDYTFEYDGDTKKVKVRVKVSDAQESAEQTTDAQELEGQTIDVKEMFGAKSLDGDASVSRAKDMMDVTTGVMHFLAAYSVCKKFSAIEVAKIYENTFGSKAIPSLNAEKLQVKISEFTGAVNAFGSEFKASDISGNTEKIGKVASAFGSLIACAFAGGAKFMYQMGKSCVKYAKNGEFRDQVASVVAQEVAEQGSKVGVLGATMSAIMDVAAAHSLKQEMDGLVR